MINHNEAEDGDALSKAYEILQEESRRIVVQHLNEVGPTSVEELARLLRSYRNKNPDKDPDNALRSEIIQLHHNDLPRMEDYGYVDYDIESKTVAPTESARELFDLVPDGTEMV